MAWPTLRPTEMTRSTLSLAKKTKALPAALRSSQFSAWPGDMRISITILLLLILAAAVFAMDLEDSIGDWSSVHQRLQARLVARYTTISLNGEPGGPYAEFLIYLELRNTSPTLSTLKLNVDMDAATNVTYRVTDAQGTVVEPERGAFRSSFPPGLYHLVLPPDSTLRFPISMNGGGVFEDKVKLDLSPRQGIWYFDKSSRLELNLSGILRVPASRDRIGPLWWKGELQIPPVKLRIPGKPQPGSPPNAAEPHRR